MLSEPNKPFPPAAYAILDQGILLTASPDYLKEHAEHVDGPDPIETWKAVHEAVKKLRIAISGGRIDVGGVQDDETDDDASTNKYGLNEQGEIILEASCKYCSYGVLCGKSFLV